MGPFAIITKPIALHTIDDISKLAAHNVRNYTPDNADPGRADMNQILIGPGPDGTDIGVLIAERIGSQKLRKDARRAAGIIMTASPEYFRPDLPEQPGYYNPNRLKSWVEKSIAWAKSKWGDNIISATLHLDETTPHIHLIVIPQRENGSMSFKEFFGGAKYNVSNLFTEYANEMAPLGLKRGILKEITKIKYESVKKFYKAVENCERGKIDIDSVDNTKDYDLKAPKGFLGVERNFKLEEVKEKLREARQEEREEAKKKLVAISAQAEMLRVENQKISARFLETENDLKTALAAAEAAKSEAERKYHQAKAEARVEAEKRVEAEAENETLNKIIDNYEHAAKYEPGAILAYGERLLNEESQAKEKKREVKFEVVE